ncbi:ethanolamine ammonia lyase large subunit [Komagataeibacter rhaeticus]|uniref:Ethanolamine ammonia-lyase large subunit n=1 Tax=Komagataeibacter rhaeticus TaxID=215221 RepID=A0A181CCT0_9PROT|nr:ethanolamine ammonia-lyase subunit EutB [Komagataeibacter rhaeticus]ATU71795.1 ethanolamine ammonia lyase large subunit [Komagataeibacter xylinus]EGG75760.1 Ethanolamine ammonia-lyase heavy chain [Gluconacetobacter sp. SXCC-1]KDU96102.1 ethanolamine ammonia-lyase [Komagataeibacter rhaeticus AF1]MBL7240051.1 ethanolamine ammonia-lyase subunit EutB [Komagataeibacter rhaeticus]PYD54779.1 ethanolamine ammonia lyase large subunit [Komagataeibacter rhaeticus]
MSYHAFLGGEKFRFSSLKQVLAYASPYRTGDELAGVAAPDPLQRIGAREALANIPLRTFLDEVPVPYETDEVTRLIIDSHDTTAFAPVAHMTVGDLRDWLLHHETDGATLAALAPGLTPEMVAAVSKLMRNQDLVSVARKITVRTAFRNTQGLPGRMGSRLQPNHPVDSLPGIAASMLDGLLLGVGDAVVGINPASDNMANARDILHMLEGVRVQYDIPMQTCLLTHVTNTLQLMERNAPVDLVFQSISGTQEANAGFGISLSVLSEAHMASQSLGRGTVGTNTMYFETGQGSALSANAHHGMDQQTAEVRAYAVARAFSPLLVNTVVGFIGPEYLYDGKQIIRAGLEDHFCGKLMGLPMGCDVCYTNHAEADQDDMDSLMMLLCTAGINFLIAVPGSDDIMLNYQSLSYHDIQTLRSLFGVRAAPEFETWLAAHDLIDARGRMRVNSPDILARMIPCDD